MSFYIQLTDTIMFGMSLDMDTTITCAIIMAVAQIISSIIETWGRQ